MRWSTEKFAQDVLFACNVLEIPIKKAIEILDYCEFFGDYSDCPMELLSNYRCERCEEDTGKCRSNCYKWYRETPCHKCKYSRYDESKYYNKMAELWGHALAVVNKKRIRLLEQWFIKHGYLD